MKGEAVFLDRLSRLKSQAYVLSSSALVLHRFGTPRRFASGPASGAWTRPIASAGAVRSSPLRFYCSAMLAVMLCGLWQRRRQLTPELVLYLALLVLFPHSLLPHAQLARLPPAHRARAHHPCRVRPALHSNAGPRWLTRRYPASRSSSFFADNLLSQDSRPNPDTKAGLHAPSPLSPPFFFSAPSAFHGDTRRFAVSKDMVQLQTQIQELQDAIARLQQSNDERMGVLKDLVQQSADSVNRMSVTIDGLQKQLRRPAGPPKGHKGRYRLRPGFRAQRFARRDQGADEPARKSPERYFRRAAIAWRRDPEPAARQRRTRLLAPNGPAHRPAAFAAPGSGSQTDPGAQAEASPTRPPT